MRLRELFLLPAVVASLTAMSTGCYGGSASDTNDATMNNPNMSDNMRGTGTMSRGAPNPNGQGNIPTTSSTYSSSTTVTRTTPANPNKMPSTSSPFATTGQGCSTHDLSVFEEADEEGVYGDYGFTRGDIKNLFITKYDPKSEQTINGNVMKILRVQYTDGNCYFIAVVRIDSGVILVNLGPVWFADENNMVINEGDAVQITGSLIRTNGRYILIGRQLNKDGRILQLRNLVGNTQWGSPRSQRGTSSY